VAPSFPGTSFKEMVAGVTWPSTLPLGWTIEWDANSVGEDREKVAYGSVSPYPSCVVV
jgi:hypothetical protein